MSSFEREEIKRILTRTMEDVKKFQKKTSQLDKKKINELNEKINLLVKENKTLKKLDFGTENDEEAREVARRELQLKEARSRREYERQIKRSKKRQYRQYTQENLESESSEEEEVKHKKSKLKKKRSNTEIQNVKLVVAAAKIIAAVALETMRRKKSRKKMQDKKNKVSQYIKKNQSNLR